MNTKVLLLAVACLIPQVSGSTDTYVGAVVEYTPVKSINEKERVEKNVAEYKNLMKKAKDKLADIIVFPENGLLDKTPSPIPDPADRISPCDSTDFLTTQTVKELSCAAKTNKIYTVVNLVEHRRAEPDDNSNNNKIYVYNTNVVFDRQGVVIARYAKYNLYGETCDRPEEPELVFFDTDFGVRFGTFICFDILFGTPTLRLVEQFGITDFVYTTHWFSELPFLTALQAQAGWAESNNVNLLASGFNDPLMGSAGSGIFNGKNGALTEVFPEKKTTKLLIANVPKMKSGNNYIEPFKCKISPSRVNISEIARSRRSTKSVDGEENEIFLKPDNMSLYNTAVINPGRKFDQTICSRNDFCCSFQVTIWPLKTETYGYNFRAVVSDGVRAFGEATTGGFQACGVVLCVGPHLVNCTSRVKNINGIFKASKIKIQGNFLLTNSLQIPSTLADGETVKPLSANKYIFKKEDKDSYRTVSLELVWPVTNLHTFAIWGRDFTRDGDPVSPLISNAPLIMSGPVLLLSTLLLAIIRY